MKKIILILIFAMAAGFIFGCSSHNENKHQMETFDAFKTAPAIEIPKCTSPSQFRLNAMLGRAQMHKDGDNAFNTIAIDEGQVTQISFVNLYKHGISYCKYVMTLNYKTCKKTIYLYSGYESIHIGQEIKPGRMIAQEYGDPVCDEQAFKEYAHGK